METVRSSEKLVNFDEAKGEISHKAAIFILAAVRN
jgi:hypothetical protein